MPGWLPIIVAYSTFGFMYLLVLGFLTTRLEDDSLWTTQSAASTFSAMGFAMIFGGPTFVTLAHKIGVRLALATAFGLWPIFVGIVITGYPTPTLLACIGLGFLFSALPTLITLYVVENTTVKDYGPSFAAATLAFGIAQTISPPIGGYLADLTGSFTLVFMLAALMSVIGLLATLKLPRNAP
jgi:MFS family permease